MTRLPDRLVELLRDEADTIMLMLRHVKNEVGENTVHGVMHARDVYLQDSDGKHIDREIILQVIEKLRYDYRFFTPKHFIKHVSKHIGKPVNLVPMLLSRDLPGALIQTEESDFIFYNSRQHPVHQAHVIVHESAHILLNHEGYSIPHDYMPSEFQRIVEASTGHFRVVSARLMNAENTPEEEEAETFANIFMSKVSNVKTRHLLDATRNVNLFPPFHASSVDE